MKLTNIIVIVVLVVLCAFGWLSYASNSASQVAEYDAYLSQAKNCMERGLYQRAIENYLSALDGKADEDIYLNIADAYSRRFKEAPADTFDDYLAFMKTALNAFPGNRTLVEHLVSLCTNEELGTEDYKTLYTYLKVAIANGCNDEEMLDLYAHARYAYSLRSGAYRSIIDSGNGRYSVLTEYGWNIYVLSEGYQLTSYWNYAGPSSSDGITVITGSMENEDPDSVDGIAVVEESRIFDASSSMVLGIFQNPVTTAGIFAEGLIPAQVNGKYGYYDDYADHKFGSFDYAGTFQDGLAAVETEGKWVLVDTAGMVARDGFEQIVIDLSGLYLVNDTIMVKESGSYVVYNSKWERKAVLSCDEVDILSSDGIIAFCTGGKWGFADMTGNVVITPEYTNARSFSNGLAAVQNSDGLWGYIDRENRLIIDYIFTDAGYMSSAGVCPVQEFEVSYDADTGEQIVIPGQWRLLYLTNGITED